MKKNKKVKKIEKERKPRKRRTIKIIISIILLIIIMAIAYFIYSIFQNANETNKIKATKIITEDELNQTIEYTIKIKDYNIESTIKEITFKTEQEAKAEYNRYEIINEYERRGIGIELKKKKLILTMPEEQLLQDIEYNTEIIRTMTFENGEKIEIIDQNQLKKCLIEQGYSIK